MSKVKNKTADFLNLCSLLLLNLDELSCPVRHTLFIHNYFHPPFTESEREKKIFDLYSMFHLCSVIYGGLGEFKKLQN